MLQAEGRRKRSRKKGRHEGTSQRGKESEGEGGIVKVVLIDLMPPALAGREEPASGMCDMSNCARPCVYKGSELGLVLCCHCFEILNFRSRIPQAVPHNLSLRYGCSTIV
jgi:hypothetical protein